MAFNFSNLGKYLNLAQQAYDLYKKVTGSGQETSSATATQSRRSQSKPAAQARTNAAASQSDYPGDYQGQVNFMYSPNLDGDPDPGEVVWTWVPYEEDYSQGKDRPVLLIGREGNYLLALMLTSKDKNNANQHNSDYLDIGTGAWDKEGRPSEVKLNRVIRVSPEKMRREGAVMDEATFNTIKEAFEDRF